MAQLVDRSKRHQHTDTSALHKEGMKSSRPVSHLAMRTPVMQTKLEVNTPGDIFEQEADAVANSVMQAPIPLPQPDDNRANIQRMAFLEEEPIQRQSTPEEETLQRQAAPEEETLQRQGDGKPGVSPSTAATIRNPGVGNPILSSVRHRIEPYVGANLSGVRVHTGTSANKAASSLQSRAFTHGNHIFLNSAESSTNVQLMAHESTHVVQQGAAPIQRQAIAEEVSVQRQTVPTIQRLSLSSILDTAENVIDLPDALVQLVHDIENAGGIFAYLENLISGVVDSIFGGLQRGADSVSNLIQNFTQLFTSTAALGTAIINGDRQGFTDAVINLTTALQAIFGDAWDALDTLLGPVRDFLDGVLATLQEPITAWIERLAGGIWNTIVNIGQHIWDWTADIRNSSLVNWAWNDIREELGITGPDTFDGLLVWVKGLANDAWETIKGQFSGVITAIQETVTTIREVISVENIRSLREMVDAWIVNARDFVLALNADEGNGVASKQDLLRDVLIPAIKAGAATLREAIVGAGNWIAGLISNLATKVTGFIENLRSVPILSAVPELFDWVSTAVNDLSTWAQSTVKGLFTSVGDGIVYLTQFIEPFLTTLTNLVTATSDLLNNLPNLISAAWNAIPAWIRDPIKDFVLNKVLARIPLFGELVRNPEVWAQVQETAMRILQQIFVAGDLRGAAWTFFQALLELLHFPSQLVVQIINKAVAVFNNIIENPGGFFMNLLQAVKQGFSSFFDNILTHLLNGVQGWLLGQAAEAGIQPPQDFSLGSIFKFVLDVLGINMDLIWERLSVKIGAERVAQIRRAINVLTGAWEWISIAINEGPGALWEKLQERLSQLWDQVLNGVIDWITQTIIERATVRLLSMLDPTGIMAVVNSVIALYSAIESFIQYFTQILEIVNKVLDGIQEIASGAVAGAAQFLETALADALPIAIGFLANQVGLGGLGARLREMIEMVRGYVIQGIDWLIDQAIRLGGAVLTSVRSAAGAVVDWWRTRKQIRTSDGETHTLFFSGSGTSAELMIASQEVRFRRFIEQVNISNNDPKKSEKENAKVEALRILEEIESLKSRTDPQIGARTPDFEILLNQLSPHVIKLIDSASENVPESTPPIFGGVTTSGFGTTMDIFILTNKGIAGTRPSVAATSVYKTLERRKISSTSNTTFYRKGHLLSQELHGTGNTWNNLTPLSESGNQTLEQRAENRIKTVIGKTQSSQLSLFAGSGVTSGGIVKYSVAVVYQARGDKQNLQNAIDSSNKNPAAKSAIKTIIDAEDNVPVHLIVSIQEIDKNGNPVAGGLNTPSLVIPNDIKRQPNEYYVLEDKLPSPSSVPQTTLTGIT